jgi:hypothetical protein
LSIHNGIEWDPIKRGKGSQQTTAGAVLRPGSGDVSASATGENDEIDIHRSEQNQEMAFTLDGRCSVADR